jgi:diketogulonate reductase-like aldo/keto reductase
MRTRRDAMKLKPLGNTGEKIPELGLGTWKMGGSPEEERAAIRRAISMGMNLIDTAEMYGNEAMVGDALEGEKGFFIATKASPHHFKRDDLIRACRESLSKLGVKAIDLYQLHWPSMTVDIKETISAMEELVDMGLIRYIGVSNFSTGEMEATMAAMKKYELVSNQVEYSLAVRDIERDGILDYCRKNRMTVIAYTPLAKGVLFDGSQPRLAEAVAKVGKRHGKTPAQIALNWVVSHGPVVAIPKTSSAARVAENAGASGWKMTSGEMALLESSSLPKPSMASGLRHFAPAMGLFSRAYQGVSSFRNRNSHRSSRTTRSSKK